MSAVSFSLNALSFIQRPSSAEEVIAQAKQLFMAVLSEFPCDELTQWSYNDDRYRFQGLDEILSIPDFEAKGDFHFRMDTPDKDYPKADFHVSFTTLDADIYLPQMKLKESIWYYTSFLKKWVPKLEENLTFGPALSMVYHTSPGKYKLKRPKYKFWPFPIESPINLIDRRHLKADGDLEIALPLFEKELPPGVSREWITEDVALITWVHDAVDEDDLLRQYYIKEDWMRENMELKLSVDWNQYGDKILRRPQIGFTKKKDDEFIEIYYRPKRMAIKRISLEESNNLKHKTWIKLAEYSASQTLAGGATFDKVGIALPSRELAIEMQKKAKELHFDKAYYEGDQNVLYDIWPEGDFRE